MKKILKTASILCLMAALLLSLCSCGSKTPVGTWECVNMEETFREQKRRNGYSEEEIDRELSEQGVMYMFITINEDHTADVRRRTGSKEKTETYTWITDENGIILTRKSETVNFVWDGNDLEAQNSEPGMNLIFRKE